MSKEYTRIDFIKINGRITSFTNEYDFLAPTYNIEFNYMGSHWISIQQAYNSLVEENFNTHRKLMLMGNIIYSCYSQNEELTQKLLSTKTAWLQNSVKNHDNFWHNCNCSDCFMENGENYYGRLVMEVRDYIIWQRKRKTKTSKRWALRYFNR